MAIGRGNRWAGGWRAMLCAIPPGHWVKNSNHGLALASISQWRSGGRLFWLLVLSLICFSLCGTFSTEKKLEIGRSKLRNKQQIAFFPSVTLCLRTRRRVLISSPPLTVAAAAIFFFFRVCFFSLKEKKVMIIWKRLDQMLQPTPVPMCV